MRYRAGTCATNSIQHSVPCSPERSSRTYTDQKEVYAAGPFFAPAGAGEFLPVQEANAFLLLLD